MRKCRCEQPWRLSPLFFELRAKSSGDATGHMLLGSLWRFSVQTCLSNTLCGRGASIFSDFSGAGAFVKPRTRCPKWTHMGSLDGWKSWFLAWILQGFTAGGYLRCRLNLSGCSLVFAPPPRSCSRTIWALRMRRADPSLGFLDWLRIQATCIFDSQL